MAKILFSTLATALLLSVGCGGGGNGGGNDGGDGDMAKPAGSYASCTASGGASTQCFAFPLPAGGSATAICAADTADELTWTSVSSCALPGLVGCCGMSGNWECFYDNTNDPKSSCTGDDGTWTTTAP